VSSRNATRKNDAEIAYNEWNRINNDSEPCNSMKACQGSVKARQEAQLSQKDHAMLRVIEQWRIQNFCKGKGKGSGFI